MPRLAGYQAFCWFAIAFYTIGGTASRSEILVLGLGLASTLAAAALSRASARVLKARTSRV